MASPFQVFRKHQKILIATLCFAAMIAFVFLGIISRSIDSAGPSSNPVVVTTTKYGDLKQNKLRSLRAGRNKVLSFFDALQRAVRRNGGMGFAIEMARMRLGEGRDPRTEQAVVDTWLRTQHARQLGMVVGEETIYSFIKQLSEDCVPEVEWTGTGEPGPQEEGIFAQINATKVQIFELLKRELLALHVRDTFARSTQAITPKQRWDYYLRVNRMAAIEAIEVRVADRLERVTADPGEARLREFFEEYKETAPKANSPEPGFRRPHQVVLNYFKAGQEEVMALVSADEVKKYYEKHKEEFDQPAAYEAAAAESAESTEEKAEPTGEATEPVGEEDESGKEESPPVEGGESTEEESPPVEEGESAEEESPPVEEEKKEESAEEASGEPAEDADGSAPESNGSDDTSSTASASPFMLASLRQEEADDQKTPEPAEPAAEEESAPSGPELPAADADSDDESADAADEPNGEPKEPVAEPAATPPDEPEAPDAEPPEGVEKTEEKAPEEAGREEVPQAPWEGKVGEEIRATLARQKIDEAFSRIQAAIREYRDLKVLHDAVPGNPLPQEPDIAKLAGKDLLMLLDEQGKEVTAATSPDPQHVGWLIGRTTGPVSVVEVMDLDIGGSAVANRIAFGRHVFERKVLFSPERSYDQPGNAYLFWKVKDEADKVLEFDDPGVRDQVLRAWKLTEARKLALAEAEDLAEEARKEPLSLKEIFRDRFDIQITVTAPFSWMTYGRLQPQDPRGARPEISEVTGVQSPGPDFMSTVFGLKQGEIGVAMNQPESIAYVVRVTEFNKQDAVLWEGFTVDPYSGYAAVGQEDQWKMFEAWQTGLETDAGLKWNRKADPR